MSNETRESIIDFHEAAKARAQSDYFNHHSPHCGDIERFRWAVDSINQKMEEELKQHDESVSPPHDRNNNQ